MKKFHILGSLFALLLLWQCADSAKDVKSNARESIDTTPAETGEELAKIHCASCHKYPSPDLLDKRTWGEAILLRMASLMGIYHDQNAKYVNKMPTQWIEPGIGGQRVREAKIYPDEPLISIGDWEKIRNFYYKNAPNQLPAAPKKEIKIGLPNFEVSEFNKSKIVDPLVQSIAIDENNKKVYAGIYEDGIYQLDEKGKLLNRTNEKAFYVDFHFTKDRFMALDMASRHATDNPQGKFQVGKNFLDLKRQKNKLPLTQLMRPVHFTSGDLDGDGGEDVLISEYGFMLGQLAWYKPSNNWSQFEQHILFPDDGAIKAEILDLNGDGQNDILALMANGDEGIDRYINQGNGQFKRERVLRFSPTNGSTDFQVIDFDGDGKTDILYANGDNGDYTPILKPYHGIHLYLNKNDQYEETFFLPMNGVYQAEAVDFDQDGDLDIAAVSFHPDFNTGSKESFVYFENDGQNNFQSYTIPQHADSRWMRFATGDVDADGDVDILLSAMNIKTPEVPQQVADKWVAKETAILILKNEVK